jgi:hypothetical protein
LNAKDEKGHNTLGNIVQTFSAKVSALGTSTGGLAPGTLTASSSAPWLVITSITGSSVGFNVFGNTSTSPRTGVIQAAGAANKATLTIGEAGSTAPVLNRQVTYLYQRILVREPVRPHSLSGLTASPPISSPAPKPRIPISK